MNRILGISRMFDNKKAVLVAFEDEPSDDDMRMLHDCFGLYEKLEQYIEKTASMYQKIDGSPGPLSIVWGWRDIAEHLRNFIVKLKGETLC